MASALRIAAGPLPLASAHILKNLILESLRHIASTLHGPLESLMLAGNSTMSLLAVSYLLDYAGGNRPSG